jgi:hypothetical protein
MAEWKPTVGYKPEFRDCASKVTEYFFLTTLFLVIVGCFLTALIGLFISFGWYTLWGITPFALWFVLAMSCHLYRTWRWNRG